MFGIKKNKSISEVDQKQKEEILKLFSKKNENFLKNIDILGKFLFKISFQSNLDSESFPSLLKECELRNKKFTDREFPPNQLSLINSPNTYINSKWKKIKWKRASEYMTEYTIFPKKFNPGEIVQGVLNNNTFLSVVAALAENPSFIKSIFITQEINNYGIYGVYLCKDGKYIQYIIDDYFPCDNKLLIECFSHGVKNTIWVQILEKCYAKAYGAYSNIETKDLDRIVHDLTCAPIVTLDNSLKNLYVNLEEANKKNWIILASAGDTESGHELLKEIGLVPGNAYAVINVFKIEDDFEPPEILDNIDEREIEEINSKYLLQIRNHWEKDGWLGDWSEGSMNWTEDMKKKMDYDSNCQNSFYMNLKDFKHYFSKIKICKIFQSYKYNYLCITQKVDSYSLVKIKINSENKVHGFLTFSQLKNKKAFPNLEYGIIRIIICKLISYNENTKEFQVDYLSGKMGQERDIFEENTFEPGEYLVYTELNKNIIESSTVLSTYSEKKIEMEQLNISNFPKVLEKIYTSCAKKSGNVSRFTKDGANECIKYSNSTPEGYTYIYIENNEKDITLIESVSYTKFENLKLLEPFKGTSYKVQVDPGKTQIVLIKQLELSGYKLVFSYHSNFLYEKNTLLELTKKQGKKNYRKDPKLNIDLDIVVYAFQYSSGLCFYYENNTQDRKLEETLKLVKMIGVEIVGEHEKDDEVKIEINPGEQRLVQLKAIKPNWSVQSNVSYFIREAFT